MQHKAGMPVLQHHNVFGGFELLVVTACCTLPASQAADASHDALPAS